MNRCPKGAVVSYDELKIMAGAAGSRLPKREMTIDSDRRPNRAFHDAEYRSKMKSLRESLALYRSTLKKVVCSLKAKRR